MSSPEEDDNKQYEPTERRLEEARKKGNIPRTPDLYTTCAYAGFLAALLVLGRDAIEGLGQGLTILLDRADQLQIGIADGMTSPVSGAILGSILASVLPLIAVPFLAVVAVIAAQRGFIFRAQKVAPDLSRINPVKNAGNKYGRSGLFEFLKSLTKLCVISVAFSLFMTGRFDEISSLSLFDAPATVGFMGEFVVQFLWIAVAITAAIAVVDLLWQIAEHRRKNMMSHKELQDELKEAEGDPHIKSHRRAMAREIANNGMLKDMAGADVVIVNPTHYAVALKWEAASDAAPVCVAKGVDQIAMRIREIAEQNHIPIRRDPPTARALFATVELGQEIDQDHYRAVAAAIRFAQDIRRKQKQSMTR